jgi:hypothetical protein
VPRLSAATDGDLYRDLLGVIRAALVWFPNHPETARHALAAALREHEAELKRRRDEGR